MNTDFFNYFLNPYLQIGGFFVTIVTLILAWKISKNFDVKKTYINEQLKIVCQLSNELYNFGLPTQLVSGGIASNYPRFFNFFNQKGIESYKSIYFSTMQIEDILPFINYQHNILLPEKIAKRIKAFDVMRYQPTDDKDMPQRYIFIYTLNKKENDNNFFYYYMDYNLFYEYSILLVDEIANWLKGYGAKDINFPKHMKNSK
jgi:hypothetical protein